LTTTLAGLSFYKGAIHASARDEEVTPWNRV